MPKLTFHNDNFAQIALYLLGDKELYLSHAFSLGHAKGKLMTSIGQARMGPSSSTYYTLTVQVVCLTTFLGVAYSILVLV